MNLARCGRLTTLRVPGVALNGTVLSTVWYRAIQPQFWTTALQTAQTATFPSRFNQGPPRPPRPSRHYPSTPFEILYLGENHQVALFEVEALVGSPFSAAPVLPNPNQAWVILNVTVQLQKVADLSDPGQQSLIATTVQELTGDWRGYHYRTPHTSVKRPAAPAPTQELGAALHATPDLEGFLSVSARVPTDLALLVFPQKLQPGSFVEFAHPTLGRHRISG